MSYEQVKHTFRIFYRDGKLTHQLLGQPSNHNRSHSNSYFQFEYYLNGLLRNLIFIPNLASSRREKLIVKLKFQLMLRNRAANLIFMLKV